MAVQTQIQTRRGSAATWTSTNPTLAAGEIGFESDTNKFKIGTGSTAWVSLPYASNVSPLTTKGDLYTYSTDNARLAVGANGETLVADSSTSTGLRYQAPVNVNPVLNSAFQVAQRGTSIAFNSRAGYGLDRWYVFSNPSSTISQQPTGDTTNLPFIQYCMRVQRNSGSADATPIDISQPFETLNSVAYAGKTVTLSFYARAGADYSPTSNALAVKLYSGTGVDQNIYVTYTGGLTPINQTATLTTTWQRFSYTATLNSNVTELQPQFVSNCSGTAGANDYYEITGVQLEVGSVATPFKTNGGTIQGELAACQRYCWSVTSGAIDRTISQGGYYNSTTFVSTVAFPVTMRTTPSATIVNGTNYWVIYANNTQDTGDNASVGGAGLNAANFEISGNVSGTTGHSGQLRSYNASASVILSAEL
jgi:hypothetical protein